MSPDPPSLTRAALRCAGFALRGLSLFFLLPFLTSSLLFIYLMYFMFQGLVAEEDDDRIGHLVVSEAQIQAFSVEATKAGRAASGGGGGLSRLGDLGAGSSLGGILARGSSRGGPAAARAPGGLGAFARGGLRLTLDLSKVA